MPPKIKNHKNILYLLFFKLLYKKLTRDWTKFNLILNITVVSFSEFVNIKALSTQPGFDFIYLFSPFQKTFFKYNCNYVYKHKNESEVKLKSFQMLEQKWLTDLVAFNLASRTLKSNEDEIGTHNGYDVMP